MILARVIKSSWKSWALIKILEQHDIFCGVSSAHCLRFQVTKQNPPWMAGGFRMRARGPGREGLCLSPSAGQHHGSLHALQLKVVSRWLPSFLPRRLRPGEGQGLVRDLSKCSGVWPIRSYFPARFHLLFPSVLAACSPPSPQPVSVASSPPPPRPASSHLSLCTVSPARVPSCLHLPCNTHSISSALGSPWGVSSSIFTFCSLVSPLSHRPFPCGSRL